MVRLDCLPHCHLRPPSWRCLQLRHQCRTFHRHPTNIRFSLILPLLDFLPLVSNQRRNLLRNCLSLVSSSSRLAQGRNSCASCCSVLWSREYVPVHRSPDKTTSGWRALYFPSILDTRCGRLGRIRARLFLLGHLGTHSSTTWSIRSSAI